MDNLRAALQRLNIPADRLEVVQGRVEARLTKNVLAKWCTDFRTRAEALLAAYPFTPPYAEAYHALRGQLVAQGIIDYAGEHGIVVPDEEIDRTPKPAAPVVPATRPQLPAHLRPTNKQVVVGKPAPVTVQPAASASAVDPGVTPEHRANIDGMYVERADGSWVLECDIMRGDRIQIATVMDDGNDHSFERTLTAHGSQRIELELPAGRRPTTVVIVVLDANAEVGRGIIGGPAN